MPRRDRHPEDPPDRLRADRDRPGGRVRLLRRAGLQGAARGGLRGRPRQLEPGDDHDRPRVRHRHLHRAAAARPGGQDHREGAPRRAAADPRRPDRAQPGDGAARGRHPGALRGRADRRRLRRDPPRRGPRGVPPDDERGRPARPLVDDGRERSARSRRRSPTAASTLPAIVRPAFTLGGQGGGVGRTETELRQVVSEGLAASPINQVLVEESVLGWGEFELEVMRDRNDNVVIICSIENVDPMGVHTGDSVTVAPAQTLTDPLYQELRDQAIKVIRAVGVETGGSNIQFARQPRDRRDRRDRDEPARLALLGAGLEGDRLPDREDGGEARRRLRARGDPQRHHPGDAGLLRADDRLRRHQDPALRLREVPRRRGPALDPHAERRRGDGDRPHLPRVLRQGDALARARLRPPSSPTPTRSCSTALEMPCAGALRPDPRGLPRAASASRRSTSAAWSTAGSCASCEALADEGDGTEGLDPHLQGGRHLRRRVRGGDALLLLGPRAPAARRRRLPPRSAAASATRSSSSAPARTGSARGSSSTTAACTPR